MHQLLVSFSQDLLKIQSVTLKPGPFAQQNQEGILFHLVQQRFVATRSPYLSTCDFYLWGYFSGKVYDSNPHTLDELRKNIRNAIETV